MKMRNLALATTLFALASSAMIASAQEQVSNYYSISDGTTAVPTAIADAPSVADEMASDAIATDSSCNGGCGDTACEPWRLFDETCRGWQAYGWIDIGYTYNSDDPATRYNGPLSFNDRDDEFQANQMYVVLEKTIDPGCDCWEFGGRVDMIFGTDGRFTQARGLEQNQNGGQDLNSGQRFYHLAIPQFYAEIGKGDVSFKIGHFYTIIGYEGVASTRNFFYSHAYTMQYGEPFTHTGVLMTYDYSSQIQFKAGVTNGWNIFSINDLAGTGVDHGEFLGGVFWTSCDENTTLAGTVSVANAEVNIGGPTRTRTLFSAVATHKFCGDFEYVIQSDIGQHNGASGITNGADAEWYGVNQYLFYTINDCWKAGLRYEWFRDDDGARVAAVGNGNPAGGPFVGNFQQFTAGLNWTPTSNLTIRPEARWDWFSRSVVTTNPFDDGTKNSQFTLAIDAVFQY